MGRAQRLRTHPFPVPVPVPVFWQLVSRLLRSFHSPKKSDPGMSKARCLLARAKSGKAFKSQIVADSHGLSLSFAVERPMARLIVPLRPNTTRSASVLPGQTDVYALQLPLSCTHVTVRMRRKGGDPLLMLRCNEPPRVPRRSKVLADAWDQESFDGDAADHVVSLQLPTSGVPGEH